MYAIGLTPDRTCIETGVISSAGPAKPDPAKTGGGCTLFRPPREALAARLRRSAFRWVSPYKHAIAASDS
jgi:hypothetical protein